MLSLETLDVQEIEVLFSALQGESDSYITLEDFTRNFSKAGDLTDKFTVESRRSFTPYDDDMQTSMRNSTQSTDQTSFLQLPLLQTANILSLLLGSHSKLSKDVDVEDNLSSLEVLIEKIYFKSKQRLLDASCIKSLAITNKNMYLMLKNLFLFQENLQHSSESQINSLKMAYESLQTQVDRLEEDRSQILNELNKKERTQQLAEFEVINAVSEKKILQKKLLEHKEENRSQLFNIQKEIAMKEEAITKLHEELNSLKEKQSFAESKTQEVITATNDTTEVQKKDNRANSKSVKIDRNDPEFRIQYLIKEIRKKEASIDRLKTENELLNENIQNLRDHLAESKNEIKVLCDKLSLMKNQQKKPILDLEHSSIIIENNLFDEFNVIGANVRNTYTSYNKDVINEVLLNSQIGIEQSRDTEIISERLSESVETEQVSTVTKGPETEGKIGSCQLAVHVQQSVEVFDVKKTSKLSLEEIDLVRINSLPLKVENRLDCNCVLF